MRIDLSIHAGLVGSLVSLIILGFDRFEKIQASKMESAIAKACIWADGVVQKR